jgi:hypothetical protein
LTGINGVTLAALFGPFASFAQPAATLRIPPVRASLDVGGQPLAITAWGDVTAISGPPGMYRITLTADLSDLQKNLTPLLSAQLNRSGRCGERISLQNASLVPAAPAGILTANLHYERWGCAKVFGKEVVKRLVGGNGVVEVRLTPSVAAQSISLTSEVQRVDADGSLGELLRSGSVGASLREKIAATIQKAVQKGTNFQSLLPASLDHAIALQDVEFSGSGSGQLWIALHGDAQIPPELFDSLGGLPGALK